MMERQTNYDLKLQMEDLMNKDERNQDDLESLQHVIQEQEQTIRDLEDRAIYYQEQLHLLQMGIKIAGWWNTWSWLIVNDEETPGVIDEAIANFDTTINKQDVKDMLEDQYKNVSAIKSDYEQRAEGLAQQIESLQQEYDSFLGSLVALLWGSPEGDSSKDEILAKVQSLLHSELTLKKQVNDLEKKETAYTKTIQEADSIMARVEISYQERIKELEQEKHDLREKIWSLESNVSKQKTDQKVEMKTISELIEKLEQVEQSEAVMKEKIVALEKYGEEMRNKLSERELANAKIKHEMKDQDELIKRINELDDENKKMTQEIQRLKDIEQKLAELRQSEELLRNRLGELDVVAEQSSALCQDNYQEQKMTDDGCQETSRQHQQESGDELVRTTASVHLESSHSSHLPPLNVDAEALKRTVNTLKLQIKDLETEVESKSQELESVEGGYRSEVSLASQLGHSSPSGGGGFHRYRSMRDHTGRFFLCVKIR